VCASELRATLVEATGQVAYRRGVAGQLFGWLAQRER
jgi:hypothetical protein